ncbi:MAG: hypothetical protein QY318_02040 [Candidatus Dojkabacteria bacterium]|nr:MAG: hypothetical protein QY318_02040 [Candidatus Dojkabacteria bacterium]
MLIQKYPHLEQQAILASNNIQHFRSDDLGTVHQEFNDHAERHKAIAYRTLEWLEYLDSIHEGEVFQELFGFEAAEQFRSALSDPDESNMIALSLAVISAIEINTLSVSNIWPMDKKKLMRSVSQSREIYPHIAKSLGTLTMVLLIAVACATPSTPPYNYVVCSNGYELTLYTQGTGTGTIGGFRRELTAPPGTNLTLGLPGNSGWVIDISPRAPSRGIGQHSSGFLDLEVNPTIPNPPNPPNQIPDLDELADSYLQPPLITYTSVDPLAIGDSPSSTCTGINVR